MAANPAFFLGLLENAKHDKRDLTGICLASVVPQLTSRVVQACREYLDQEPFIVDVGIKTGIKVKYDDPRAVGADRIADAVAVMYLYKGPACVIDFGTATTLCAITKHKEFLGGNIIPGVRLAMEALETRTAQLPSVEIVTPSSALGRSTVESIQAGLYWSNVGMVRELVSRITAEVFSDAPPLVIGTGGFAQLFNREKLFDYLVPDLILTGLMEIVRLNE